MIHRIKPNVTSVWSYVLGLPTVRPWVWSYVILLPTVLGLELWFQGMVDGEKSRLDFSSNGHSMNGDFGENVRNDEHYQAITSLFSVYLLFSK